MKVLFPAAKFISKSSKAPEQIWTSPKQKKNNSDRTTLLANPGSGDRKRTIFYVKSSYKTQL